MEPNDKIPEKESQSGTGNIRDFLSGTGGSKPLQKMTVMVGQMPLHRPELPCKLISVSNLHHRDKNGKVNTTTSRFVRELSSKDEPYKRTITLGEQWEELDTAWVDIENIGYLFLRNDGGRPFQVVPTHEQIQEARSRVVELGYMLMDYSLPEITKEPEPTTKKKKRTMWDTPQSVESAIVSPPIIPLWFINPGEKLEGLPSTKHPIYVRCQHGQISLTIVAIAK